MVESLVPCGFGVVRGRGFRAYGSRLRVCTGRCRGLSYLCVRVRDFQVHTYIHMYVCMYVRMYVCMYLCKLVCMYVCRYVGM